MEIQKNVAKFILSLLKSSKKIVSLFIIIYINTNRRFFQNGQASGAKG